MFLETERVDIGLLQKDVAKFVCIAIDTVKLWETDRTKPDKKNIYRIKSLLETKQR